ncbi:NAD(+) diphosphatase [Maribrevibacterium harenarium]|uniref:NAD(+) diphosphatase n=1 Tax=Maribrevibacterium harenarium TaxID=2589817 RepID=A0A501WS14_9GAMM|nr:NAD(+) diphosphatase [Maribrevibacterium harenarium]TPE50874.1 NAD(+) diphosphatase [Maribrevibacterium harenarium]
MLEIGSHPHPKPHKEALYILLSNHLVLTQQQRYLFSFEDFHPTADMRSVYCGQLEGKDVFVCRFRQPPKGFTEQGLRELILTPDETTYSVLSRAHQLSTWDVDHQFCGRCGTPLKDKHDKEHTKICPRCNLRHYPRISPCVIVSVRKGNQLLLARNVNAPVGHFSNIAGFVEAGESLEQAVVREVQEEVGITIRNLEYMGSQPWSFPHQIMVGFFAEYASGEVTPAVGEIAEAGFWPVDELPNIPNPASISGKLVLAHQERIRSNLS